MVEVADDPGTDISEHFGECGGFIEKGVQAGGRVLVHCFAGVSRSATVVVAYLITHRGMTYDQAIAVVREKRPKVNPNVGFLEQLQQLKKDSN